jgi:hypothetical protein
MIAGHFGRESMLQLITRNFYWMSMKSNIRKYCSECDNCQRMKVPRYPEHELLHSLELACNPWMHISTDFITDLPDSKGATMILMVVGRFTKIAHFIPIRKKDSPTVGRTY